MTITSQALAAGHRYDSTRVNSPCQKCCENHGNLTLTCDFDDEEGNW